MKGFKEIGNDFYLRNVTFTDYGTSSIVKGEIKNNSRNDFATVSFNMTVFGENEHVIAELDFSIRGIKSGAIKPFEEVLSGVSPSQVSRYELKHKKSL